MTLLSSLAPPSVFPQTHTCPIFLHQRGKMVALKGGVEGGCPLAQVSVDRQGWKLVSDQTLVL